MLCKNCGCELPDGTEKCTYCGKDTPILKEKKKKKAQKQTGIGCLVIFLLLIFIGLIGSCGGGADKKTSSTQPHEKYTIGQTIDEFENNYNLASVAVGSDLTINNIEVEEKDNYKLFKYVFNDNISIVGAANKKDNRIYEVSIIGIPSASNTLNNLQMFVAFGCFIGAINPELKPNQYGEVMRGLGIVGTSAEELKKLDDWKTSGDISYHATTQKVKGAFVISAQNTRDL